MRRIRLFFLLLISLPVFAKGKLDSLLTAEKKGSRDTSAVWLYASILEEADTTLDVLSYFEKGIRLAEKLHFAKGEFALYNNLGTYYKRTGDIEKSFANYRKALELSEKSRDQKSIGTAHNNLGNLYNNQGKYTDAITHYIAALKIFEALKIPKKTSVLMMSIGNVYADQRLPEKAIEYYNASLKIKEELGDKKGIASNYVNIGSVYYDTKKLDDALSYFLKALAISKEIKYARGVFVSLNNISEIYSNQKKFKEALGYMLESLELRKTEGEKVDIAHAELNVGSAYNEVGEPDKALPYLERGLALAKEANTWELLAVAYDRLARCYELKRDLRKSLDCTRYFVMYKDSLLNENNSRAVAEIETKYQTEKKDLEISKQSLEIKNTQLELGRKRTQLYVSLASVFLVLLLSYLFYTRYKLKQKQLLDEELLKQQELRSKAIIEAEEKERIRIAKDLHDGIGQQLSAVKMNLSAFENTVKTDDEVTRTEKLRDLMELVDESVKEVRAVSHNMMPNALLRSGLVSAVREFVNKISTTGLLKIDLEITGLSGRLESTTETVLYRVLQECVSNIIKHAQASRVSIQLVKHDSYLNMMLEDNGRGFDTSKLNDYGGIGLKNIISRVQFLDGTVEFDSRPGKGTTVIIDIPLK